MKKKRDIAIVGVGKLGKTTLSSLMAEQLAFHEPVKLKECHKTEEDRKQEKLQLLKQNLQASFMEEYELIKQKKSKLSRAKRDYIVREVEKHLTHKPIK